MHSYHLVLQLLEPPPQCVYCVHALVRGNSLGDFALQDTHGILELPEPLMLLLPYHPGICICSLSKHMI